MSDARASQQPCSKLAGRLGRPHVGAVVAAVIALAVSLTAPENATAGTHTEWERFTPTTQSSSDDVATHRTSDGRLHLVWVRHAGTSSEDLVHRWVGPGGALGPVTTIVQGWATMSDPALVADGDGLRVFFGGLRSTNSDEEYTALATATAPVSGSQWTLEPGLVAGGDSAHAPDTVTATVRPDGTFLQAWAVGGVYVHSGLSPSTNYDYQEQIGPCCGYSPTLATDRSAGRTTIAWHSNGRGAEGVWVQDVAADGSPVGSAVRMPGSVTMYEGDPYSSYSLDPTPLVNRPGSDAMFVVYAAGYPTQTKVLLWRVGAESSRVIAQSRANHDNVGVASTPSGRLWVTWSEHVDGRPRVFARRSNKEATAFGAKVRVASPSRSTSMYKLIGDGQNDVLDVVGLFHRGTGDSIAAWHSQIKPGLSLSAQPRRFRGRERVTFRVRDAGDPVANALVESGQQSERTNANGVARMTFGPYSSKTRIPVVVTKPGFVRDRIVLIGRRAG